MVKQKSLLHLSLPLLDQAIVSGGNFLLTILLIRTLGIASYGIFVLAWMSVLYFSSVQKALIISPLQTLGSKKQGKEQEDYLAQLGYLNLFLSLFSACLTFIVANLLVYINSEWDIASLSFPLAFCVFSYMLCDFFRKFHYLYNTVKYAVLMNLISFGGALTTIISISDYSIISLDIVLGILSFFFFVGVLISILPIKKWERFNLKKSKITIYESWAFSKWLLATSVLQWFTGNIFVITAGGILGNSGMGAIRMIQNIMGVLHVLFIAMDNIVPIKAAKIFSQKGIKGLMKYLKNTTIFGGLFTGTLLIIIAIFPELILQLLYGDDQQHYAFLLRGFTCLYALVFLAIPIKIVIQTLEKNQSMFIAYIVGGLASLLLAEPLIHHFDLLGVVSGLILVQVLMQVVHFILLQTEFRSLWKSST